MITTPAHSALALDVILEDINNNPDPGYIVIYEGDIPDTLDDDPGTELVTCTLIDGTADAFSDTNTTTQIATGFVAGDTFAIGTAIDDGTASYFRCFTSEGTARLQGDCGTADADMILPTLSIVSGVIVKLTYFNIKIDGIVDEDE